MDTLEGGHLVAFAEIDIYTKEVEVVLRPTLTSDNGSAGLRTTRFRRFTGRVEVRQPDDVPVFKGACAHQARTYCYRHHIARPYKKTEPAYIY